MSRDRSNIRAGLFVLMGLILLVVVIALLSDFSSWFVQMQTVRARFALGDNLAGLKPGSTVSIGGTPKGQVTLIEDMRDGQGVVTGSIIEFQIPAEYKVYENAHLELQQPIIGSNTSLNIRSFGGPVPMMTPQGAGWEYEASDPPIPAGLATSSAIASAIGELGVEDTQRIQIQQTIANIQQLTAALGGDESQQLNERAQRISAMVDDARTLVATLRQDAPQITAKLNESAENVRVVTADVRAKSPEWFERIDSIANRADTALSTANEMLEEYRPMLSQTLTDAKSVMGDASVMTTKARQEWVVTIDKMLNNADVALADVKAVTADVRTLTATQRPVLERTLANMRIVADQLKLASIEVRRSPWRLLYTPTEKELETDNLYDAARSFAIAADSLASTADSLQTLLDRYDQLDSSDTNLRLMLDNLHQTFEQLNSAESKFWEALGEKPLPVVQEP